KGNNGRQVQLMLFQNAVHTIANLGRRNLPLAVLELQILQQSLAVGKCNAGGFRMLDDVLELLSNMVHVLRALGLRNPVEKTSGQNAMVELRAVLHRLDKQE